VTSPSDESWWVLRAQAGDSEALDRLLRAIYQPLLRFVTRIVVNRTVAEDVLQEVMVTIYRKIQWLESPDAFRPWAYRIASRHALKHLRREERVRLHVDLDADVDDIVAMGLPASGVHERLTEMLALVSPSSRVVLALHYTEEMRLDEVAAILDIPIGTVKSRLAYGLSVLRRRLSSAGDL
jgi:RNA polymerase sigma-70 factor, ECF subfamily